MIFLALKSVKEKFYLTKAKYICSYSIVVFQILVYSILKIGHLKVRYAVFWLKLVLKYSLI